MYLVDGSTRFDRENARGHNLIHERARSARCRVHLFLGLALVELGEILKYSAKLMRNLRNISNQSQHNKRARERARYPIDSGLRGPIGAID